MNAEFHVLAADIGTTAMKMGVFRVSGETLSQIAQYSGAYSIHTCNNGLYSDIDPELWRRAFVQGCRDMKAYMPLIDVITLSGTTPGLTAMDAEGASLYPAILMLDQRSRKEAEFIIETIGLEKLLGETGNMPVAGGCSLASILWIKNNYPDIYRKTACFGHSNTYMAGWLTGRFAVDSSSASLSALYNTVKNDLTWNSEIARTFDLPLEKLPDLLHAQSSAGRILAGVAGKLGLRKQPHVVIGGNDAVLAAYSAGITEPGDVINVNGTCEISLVDVIKVTGGAVNQAILKVKKKWMRSCEYVYVEQSSLMGAAMLGRTFLN